MGPSNPMLASGNSAESVIEGPGTGLLSEESQAVIGQVLAQKQVQKLDSKALTSFEDPVYTNIPEVEDTCKGGKKTLELLYQVTQCCQKKILPHQ